MVQASDQKASWAPSFGGFSRHVQLVAGPSVEPEDAGEIIDLINLGSAPEIPRRSLKMLLMARRSWGHPCLEYCHAPEKDGRKFMNGCDTESCWQNWLQIFVALCWILQFFGCAGQFRTLKISWRMSAACCDQIVSLLIFSSWPYSPAAPLLLQEAFGKSRSHPHTAAERLWRRQTPQWLWVGQWCEQCSWQFNVK